MMAKQCSSGSSLWFAETTFQKSLSMMSAKNQKTPWVPDRKTLRSSLLISNINFKNLHLFFPLTTEIRNKWKCQITLNQPINLLQCWCNTVEWKISHIPPQSWIHMSDDHGTLGVEGGLTWIDVKHTHFTLVHTRWRVGWLFCITLLPLCHHLWWDMSPGRSSFLKPVSHPDVLSNWVGGRPELLLSQKSTCGSPISSFLCDAICSGAIWEESGKIDQRFFNGIITNRSAI